VIGLVVANEDPRDQRKRGAGCNALLPMLLLSKGLAGAMRAKVGRKATPERVRVPWARRVFQIIPCSRVALIVISAQISR